MTLLMPGAKHLLISRNYTPRQRPRTDGGVVHVQDGQGSLYGFFNTSGVFASSTFGVRYDGTIEQFLDFHTISWAQGRGNPYFFSIETEGYDRPTQRFGAPRWSRAQINSIAEIYAWAHRIKPFPLSQMTSSKYGARGVGYHRLGVPASRAQLNRGVSQTGGMLWSSAVGKTCPGNLRIAQVPEIVALTKKKINGVNHTDPATAATIRLQRDLNRYARAGLIVDGVRGPVTKAWIEWTRQVQRALNQWKTALPRLIVDGHYGKVTYERVRELQRRNRGLARPPLVIDGMVGPIMIAFMNSHGSKIPPRPRNRP